MFLLLMPIFAAPLEALAAVGEFVCNFDALQLTSSIYGYRCTDVLHDHAVET